MKTDEQLNDMAAEYANEKHPNPFFSEMRNISAQDYKAGFRAAEQAQQWVPCSHKEVLPTGTYVLRLESNGLISERLFQVSNRQVRREINYFNVVAYYRVPSPPQTETGLRKIHF